MQSPMIVEVMIMDDKLATHEVRNASAVSGAVVGATAGILGGIAGIGAAGLLGAVFGAVGGLALERNIRRSIASEAEAEEALAVPAIEPPCADCVSVRDASAGQVTWCARHDKKHVHAHRHYEYPQSFALGSMLIRPAF